jgi:hypothetical protein
MWSELCDTSRMQKSRYYSPSIGPAPSAESRSPAPADKRRTYLSRRRALPGRLDVRKSSTAMRAAFVLISQLVDIPQHSHLSIRLSMTGENGGRSNLHKPGQATRQAKRLSTGYRSCRSKKLTAWARKGNRRLWIPLGCIGHTWLMCDSSQEASSTISERVRALSFCRLGAK